MTPAQALIAILQAHGYDASVLVPFAQNLASAMIAKQTGQTAVVNYMIQANQPFGPAIAAGLTSGLTYADVISVADPGNPQAAAAATTAIYNMAPTPPAAAGATGPTSITPPAGPGTLPGMPGLEITPMMVLIGLGVLYLFSRK